MSDSQASTRQQAHRLQDDHSEQPSAGRDPVPADPYSDGLAPPERVRAGHGGLSMAAMFFGWLVAVALPTLLVAVTGAVATVAGASLDVSRGDAREQAQAVGLAGGLALTLFVLLGYFAGGYVAGRMTRFNPTRHGVAVWAFGLLVAIALTVVAAVVSTSYSVGEQLNLATVNLPEGVFDARGIFAFAVLLLTTLLAAVLGARRGQRYHARMPG